MPTFKLHPTLSPKNIDNMAGKMSYGKYCTADYHCAPTYIPSGHSFILSQAQSVSETLG